MMYHWAREWLVWSKNGGLYFWTEEERKMEDWKKNENGGAQNQKMKMIHWESSDDLGSWNLPESWS